MRGQPFLHCRRLSAQAVARGMGRSSRSPVWTRRHSLVIPKRAGEGRPPPRGAGNGFGNEIPATRRTGGHWTETHTPADLRKHNGGIPPGNQVFLLQGGGR